MNILMVLTNYTELGDTKKKTGYYLKELAYPYMFLKKNGHNIDLCSPRGFKTKPDPLSLNYSDDQVIIEFYENTKMQKKLEMTLHPGNLNKDYECIVFCGGHGAMWDFPENINLQKITRNLYENFGLIGAICHGSSIFANLKLSNGTYLVSGKKISCFTNEEEEFLKLENVVPFLLESRLSNLGAKHSKAEKFEPYIEQDNRLITAQNPASSEQFANALVDRLKYLT